MSKEVAISLAIRSIRLAIGLISRHPYKQLNLAEFQHCWAEPSSLKISVSIKYFIQPFLLELSSKAFFKTYHHCALYKRVLLFNVSCGTLST
jgi:hypothetical protein